MSAAIEDVHHRYRERVRLHTAEIAVEWLPEVRRSSLGDRQANGQRGIGAEARFVGRAV